MLYSQRAWNQAEDGDRVESTYSVARSETPSDYSKRAWDSTASLDEDLIQDRPDSYAPSSHTHNGFADSAHDTVDTLQTDTDDTRMSVLGPKTRHFAPAPWEPGGEDLVEEEEEVPEAETRSLFGGRGRHKKPKETPTKPRIFPASFAPRASSSSRPSVDVSTPTSSSSGGGRPRPPVRPGSSGTQYSVASDAVPFPGNNRYEARSAIASPKMNRRDNLDNELASSPSHPFANPRYAASQHYDDAASVNYPPSPASVYPPSIYAGKPPSGHATQPQHVASASTRDMPPPPSSQPGIPQKMAPWQYTPGSPTFQLVSLEEAQALKARQRQMSLGAVEQSGPRTRTVSGPTSRKSMLPIEQHPPQPSTEPTTETNPAQGKTLKGRRSLMNLFAKGKEKGGITRSESPPPVPSLPNRAATTSVVETSPVVETQPAVTPLDSSSHQQRTIKRSAPPALNVVITSPQPQIAHPYRDQYAPPPPIPTIQKSATPPPSFQQKPKHVPRKQSSAQTLSPASDARSPTQKPNSAPSTVQGFSGLSIRPVSTMFSSMPLDYLASPALATPVPSLAAGNSTGQSITQSPTTPSLWSSRSESVSTGSMDLPPSTPGGLVHSLSSGSSMETGNIASLPLSQKQFYGTRDIWKSQIADLEAQIRALKSEVAALKEAPCPSCGHFGGGSSCMEKTSVLNRPRAKTAAGNQRFGGGE